MLLRATYYNKEFALLTALVIGTAAMAATTRPAAQPEPDSIVPDSIVAAEHKPDTTQAATLTPDTTETASATTPPLKLDSLAAAAVEAMRPKTFKPNPIRSQWVALVLPGGGQIYNRKYWKLPIIYGGFLGCAYALTWNSQMLRDYSQAYLDIMDSDPETKSYEKMLPLGYDISGREDKFKEIFKNKKNYYRRYRDMSILAFALVYVIGVIDAYVDAELSTFDISPDLSMRMTPALFNTSPTRQGAAISGGTNFGLAMTLDF